MKCKCCHINFKPTVFLQKYCKTNDECLFKEAMYLLEKKKEVDRKKRVKETKVKKELLMTLSDWIKIAQSTFNYFIRLRDKDQPCISCGSTNAVSGWDAGHYYNGNNHYNVRFNEDNVHKQCKRPCNTDLSGNLIKYRFGLIKRIGEERLMKLDEIANITRKFTIAEVQEINRIYKEKIKTIGK